MEWTKRSRFRSNGTKWTSSFVISSADRKWLNALAARARLPGPVLPLTGPGVPYDTTRVEWVGSLHSMLTVAVATTPLLPGSEVMRPYFGECWECLVHSSPGRETRSAVEVPGRRWRRCWGAVSGNRLH